MKKKCSHKWKIVDWKIKINSPYLIRELSYVCENCGKAQVVIRRSKLKKKKQCAVCGKIKLREQFYTMPLSNDGLRSYCKECWGKSMRINIKRRRKQTIEKDEFTSGTSKNISMPDEMSTYFVDILPKLPRRKYRLTKKKEK